MKANEFLNEEFLTAFNEPGGQYVELFVNPTEKELRSISNPKMDGAIRGFLTNDKLIVWDGFKSIHFQVAKQLGLTKENALGIYLYYHPSDPNIGITVTDFNVNGPWHHNPETANWIRNHPGVWVDPDYVQVDYYDEAIVGDWEELTEPETEVYEGELLTESSRAYLFHSTSLWNIQDILKTNRLRGSKGWSQPWREYSGHGPEEIKGVSLTRDYHYAELYEAIVLVLDQERLLQDGYKIYPYDYRAMSKNASGHIPIVKNEFEEFVPGAIENLDRYIVSIYATPHKFAIYGDMTPDIWQLIFNHPKYQAWLPLEHRGKKIDEEIELTEGRDAPLYHNMRIKKALSIFTADILPGTWEHLIDNKMQQGTSFTRNSRFARQIGAAFGPIMIEINQSKLSQRHKIIPLDAELIHAHTHDHKAGGKEDIIRSDKSWNKGHRDRMLHRNHDPYAEEFVIGPINNLHLYIDKIFILDKSERRPYSPMKELVKIIKEYGKHHNIKVVDMYDKRQKKYKLTGPYANGAGATGIVVPTNR